MPTSKRTDAPRQAALASHAPNAERPFHTAANYDLYVVQMRRVWRPPTDVYETDQHVVVKVEIAGMQEDDFDISLVKRHLVIRGTRPAIEEKVIYQNMEIHYGQFRTEIEINIPLDRSNIDASYAGGFLYVKLRKADERSIPVQARAQNVQPND